MKRLSGFSLPISIAALILSCAGGAYATNVLHIGTANIQDNSVTAAKLSKGLRAELAALSNTTAIASRARTPALYDSQTWCQPGLCMENSPGAGHDGDKGGWWKSETFGSGPAGDQSVTGTPTTSLSVGQKAFLNIAVEQPGLGGAMGESGTGAIVVTYDPYDFKFVSDSRGICSATTGSLEPWFTGMITCSTNGLNVDEFIDQFTFKALHPDRDAQVSAEEILYGSGATLGSPDFTRYMETTGSFPVKITS